MTADVLLQPTTNASAADRARVTPSAAALDAETIVALRELSGPPDDAPPPPGALISLLVALPTFGLLPAPLWPFTFDRLAAAERRQLRTLAAWVRANSDVPDDGRLVRAIGNGRGAGTLKFLGAFFLVWGASMALVFASTTTPASELDNIFNATYHYRPFANAGGTGRHYAFVLWNVCLAGAYLCHWARVNLHASHVRCFLDEFNRHAIHVTLSPVFLRPVAFGFRPAWAIGAIVLLCLGAPWGVFMMLAGATQWRYAQRAGPEVRAALVDRMREMLLIRRPGIALPSDAELRAAITRPRCQTVGCRRPLLPGTAFCPRCGVRATPPLDRVA